MQQPGKNKQSLGLMDDKIIGKPNLPENQDSSLPSLMSNFSNDRPKKKSLSLLDSKIIGRSASQKIESDDSFFTNFYEGLEQGTRQLIGGTRYALADIGQAFTSDDVWAHEIKNWSKEFVSSGPEPDNSVGQFLGSLVPSTIPTGLAVGSAIATGGGTLPAIASWVAAGGLGLASAGQGLMDYDAYKQSKGQPIDPIARAAVATSYAASDFVMERLALGKYIPNVGKYLFRGNVEMAEKAGKALIAKYAKGTKTSVPKLLKEIGIGATVEGSQEALTELAQNITDNAYRDIEDRYDVGTIVKNMQQAALGGAIMGVGLGGLSYKAQDVVHNKRRRDQGFVRIGDFNGEGVEIIV